MAQPRCTSGIVLPRSVHSRVVFAKMVHFGRVSKSIKTGRHRPSITVMLLTKRPYSGNSPQQGLENSAKWWDLVPKATFQMPRDELGGNRPFLLEVDFSNRKWPGLSKSLMGIRLQISRAVDCRIVCWRSMNSPWFPIQRLRTLLVL